MLDDEAFARAWVESRDRARPRGERAIRAELALKGVDRASVDLVLAERREASSGIGSGMDWPTTAAARAPPDRLAAERLLARHAVPSSASPTLDSAASGPSQLLARNGFDPETAEICRRWRTVCREVAATVADLPA